MLSRLALLFALCGLAFSAQALVVWAPLGQEQYFLIYEAQDSLMLIGGAVFGCVIAFKLWDWLKRVVGR